MYINTSQTFKAKQEDEKNRMIHDLQSKELENQKIIQNLTVEERKSKKLIKSLMAFLILIIGFMGLSWYLKVEADKNEAKAINVLQDTTNQAILVLQGNDVSNVHLSMAPIVKKYKESKDIRIQRIVSQAWFVKALALKKVPNIPHSLKEYSRLIEHFQGNGDKQVSIYVLKSLLNKARILYKQNKREESLQLYNHLIQEFKDYQDVDILEKVIYAWHLKIFLLVDNTKKAVSLLNLINHFKMTKTPTLAKWVSRAYGNLIEVLILNKKYDESLKLAKEGEEYNGSYINIQLNLAHTYLLLNRVDEAVEIYLKYKHEYERIKNDFEKYEENDIYSEHYRYILELLNH